MTRLRIFAKFQVTDCRKKHLGNYFVPVHFKDSFLENAQESFVFGTGREPSRMTKVLIWQIKPPSTSAWQAELAKQAQEG